MGLQSQIWSNNFKSTLLLLAFPTLILALTWIFFFFITEPVYNQQCLQQGRNDCLLLEEQAINTTSNFLVSVPWVGGLVFFWFMIAYFSHNSMIASATGSRPLERKENPKIYNLVENLCIQEGMKNPKINIIEDDSLNAFASGINEQSYTVTLSRGIINKLNDKELETVIAHELTHIQNRDVRLLIISIIFVGIFSFVAEMAFRTLVYGRHSDREKKDGRIIILGLILALIGYILSLLFRFALSRKREFLADAGSARMTKNPLALASALEKISSDSQIEAVERRDVAQLFIENPQEKSNGFISSFGNLFATHPPIEERIRVLRQF